MSARLIPGFIVMMFLLVQVGQAQDRIHKYFNDTATDVRATDDPAEKREILSSSFQTMIEALDRVQGSPLISKDDRAGIDRLKAEILERQDELAGLNGFERVPDGQINSFTDYVVQSMQQADEEVTISLVALLLITIIVILLV